MIKNLQVIKTCLMGKYKIIDTISGDVYSELDKEEFLNQLKLALGEIDYSDDLLPKSGLGLKCFYDNNTGNIYIGKIKRKKNGELDKRYLRKTFYRHGDEERLKRFKQIIEEEEECS